MSNYNTKLQSNNTDLQTVLQNLQNKAAGSEQATPVISVDSNGLITATAGTKSATRQLTTQAAKTITPSTTEQVVVLRERYTTGTITVDAIPSSYVKPTLIKTETIYTPETSDQIIVAGTYCSGEQTIKGDANLIPSNIKNGVSIFGIEGIAGANGVQLPELTNEGAAADLRSGKQLIDGNGNIVVGTMSCSSVSVFKKDVNFYDCDGTLLYSYTLEEVQELIELPALPEREGLICQGWNYDLETIKLYNRAVDIEATYITDDGKTRLYIKIAAEGRMTVPLYFSQTVANGVTIDWGDGSATQTFSGTGNKNTSHTYAEIGDYVISLEVTNGTLGLGRSSSSYCVMGATSTNGQVYCNMLQKVEIGNNMTSISSYAFNYCQSLASIVIPNSVISINSYAFSYCRSLASVVIPNSVTSIDDNAFKDCRSLASIVIPDGVISIGDNAFNYCQSLASIVIPNSVISINSYAFNYCQSLASIVIPNSVTSIDDNAFSYCYSLASVVIPNSVTSISSSAFKDCQSLASVVISNSVTSISSSAFSNCQSLASIVIPNSVISINSYAFSYCYGIAFYDFTSHTSVPTLSDTQAFSNIPLDCEIRVPAALYDEWIAATNWSTYASKIVAV